MNPTREEAMFALALEKPLEKRGVGGSLLELWQTVGLRQFIRYRSLRGNSRSAIS